VDSKISYGNQDISGGIDQFWLSSSLKISPKEQADFMEALYKRICLLMKMS
jgi:beta-lactamase class D